MAVVTPPNIPIAANSWEQSHPFLKGLSAQQELQQQLQKVIAQKLQNQQMQKLMQFVEPNAMANLQKMNLGNLLSAGTMESDIGKAQQELISKQLENQLAKLNLGMATKSLGGIPSNLGDVQNALAGSPQNAMPQPQLPMSNQDRNKLDQYFGEPEKSPYEKNLDAIKDLQNRAQASAYINPHAATVFEHLAKQMQEGTPQMREQYKRDASVMEHYRAQENEANILDRNLDQMQKIVEATPEAAFYPGSKYFTQHFADWQIVRNLANGIAAYLPSIYGIPAKGLNVKLEQQFRSIAGQPDGQRKETILRDIQNMQHLSDLMKINRHLADYEMRNKGNLLEFTPYGQSSDLKRFKSKQDFQRWFESLPSTTQKAIRKHMKEGMGK